MIAVGSNGTERELDPSAWERPLGLRERKKRATRHALHSSGLRLVAERGFEAVTIEEIVAAAEVSPRTFFNYYASKEDVIVNPDPDRPTRVAEALAAAPDDLPPLAVIQAVLRQHAAELQESSEEWLLRLRLVHEIPALMPRYLSTFLVMERVLAADVARRIGADVDKDLYPQLVGGAAMAALRGAFTRWCNAGGKPSVTDLVDEAFAALSAGLVPPTAG